MTLSLRRTGPFPRVYGHRGARGVLPENTLEGFAYLREIAADAVEFDVRNAAGRVPVVIHDPHIPMSLARGPDGRWLAAPGAKVVDLTLAQLQAFDIGRMNPALPYGARFAGQLPADGARVPTLDVVLAWAARDGNDMLLNIEIKSDATRPDLGDTPQVLAADVLEAIARHEVGERVLISSFDWRVLSAVRTVDPGIARGYLTLEPPDPEANILDGAPWMDGLRQDEHGGSLPRLIAAQGAVAWCPYRRDVTPERVAEAQALGLAVNVWTVNTPKDITRMIAMGVDGIITDYPERVQALCVHPN